MGRKGGGVKGLGREEVGRKEGSEELRKGREKGRGGKGIKEGRVVNG